jgi:uncharacterized protein (DUF2235 family)
MKRIVICCDGTWNTPDRKDGDAAAPSNVVKVARAVLPVDSEGHTQVVYYDEGVGARGSMVSRMWAGMTGGGLEENINEAYRFLIDNYSPGDELYFFGFSRGAYTVRSLVGMIRKCGLLSKLNADRVIEAYWLYRNRDVGPDSGEARLFRENFSIDPKIKVRCLCVWDTVGSLGIPWRPLAFTRKRHEFHDLKLSSFVENAFQALAIDERRSQFPPAVWEVQPPAPRPFETPLQRPSEQRVEQAWFAGVHSNIGGGYRDTGLSDLALQWMTERARGLGLELDEDYLGLIANPDPFGELRESWSGFYKVTRPQPRVVCDPTRENSNETVDASAEKRWSANPSYRPESLKAHYARTGQEPR